MVKQEQKKNPKNLAKLENFKELLHASRKNNNCEKISVKTSSQGAAKWSFSSLNHCMDSKQCVHHQLVEVEERDILSTILLFPPPPFLPVSFSRGLTKHPVMNGCVRFRDLGGDCSLITRYGQQMTVSLF